MSDPRPFVVFIIELIGRRDRRLAVKSVKYVEEPSGDEVVEVTNPGPVSKKRRAEEPKAEAPKTAVVRAPPPSMEGRTVMDSVMLTGYPRPQAHLTIQTRRRSSSELARRPEIGPTPLGIDREAAGLDSPTYDTLPRDEKELLHEVAEGVSMMNVGTHKIIHNVPKLVARRSVRNLTEYGLVAGPQERGKGTSGPSGKDKGKARAGK